MPDNSQEKNRKLSRDTLAYFTLGFSAIAIAILAGIAITVDTKNALTILNIVLPVVASWVGTVLAFYFGRENFESANSEIRKMVDKLTPEERARSQVRIIMRPFTEITHFQISDGKSDADITIKELRAKFIEDVSRLPILNSNASPRYMLHASSIDRYRVAGGCEDDTLEKYINSQKANGFEFGLNKGFIVVSETSTIEAAKWKLEQIPSCQDIFITKYGTEKEPLSGWISNVRLSKFLQS